MADPAPTEQPPTSSPTGTESRPRLAGLTELLVAAAVVVLGIIVLVQTQDIRVTPAYAKVGPRVIPTIVGAGLIVLGIWYAVDILRRGGAAPSSESEDVDPSLPTDWAALGLLAVALVAYLLLIRPGGFIIASAVMFVIAAFAMGSRRYVRDIVIGILLAVAVYLVFTRGLEVRLPDGVLSGIV